MKYSLPVLTCTLLLAACGHENNEAPSQAREEVSAEQQENAQKQSGYVTYTEDVLLDGDTKVLFFHASWCPMCRDKDRTLTSWYRAESFPLSTYKVDYDTADDLKKIYGIAMQDTFVVVDGEGRERITAVAPSLSELKRLLYGNIEKARADTVEEGMDDAGTYTAYRDGVLGNGKESVLFFHAAWCPKCRANDTKLQSFYGSGQYERSVYKIDYDTADDLKKQYGVTGQDTFILIDGDGNEMERISFPSESALKELLG